MRLFLFYLIIAFLVPLFSSCYDTEGIEQQAKELSDENAFLINVNHTHKNEIDSLEQIRDSLQNILDSLEVNGVKKIYTAEDIFIKEAGTDNIEEFTDFIHEYEMEYLEKIGVDTSKL